MSLIFNVLVVQPVFRNVIVSLPSLRSLTDVIRSVYVPCRDKYLLRTVKSFGLCLSYGNKYLYQAMPRLLTIWLDYHQRHEAEQTSSTGRKY